MENEEEKKEKRIEEICTITICAIMALCIISIIAVGNELLERAIKNNDDITAKELEKIQTELNYYELKIEKLEKGE